MDHLDEASQAFPNPITGAFQDPIGYALQHPAATVFVDDTAPVHPGDTVTLLADFNTRTERFLRRRAVVATSTATVLRSLPAEARLALADDTGGMRHVTLRLISDAMRLRYSSPTVAAIFSTRQAMHTPIALASDFDRAVAVLRQLFGTMDAWNQPLSQYDRFNILLQAVTTGGLDIALTMIYYRSINPAITQQTFDSLASHLSAFFRSQVAVTTSALGYAAAVVPPPAAVSMAAVPRPAARSPRDATKYCWTHGMGMHTGAECNTKRSGHVDSATAADKRGGK